MFLNDKHELVLFEDDNGRYLYLPAMTVRLVRANWKAGKKWFECSPVHEVTRAQVAYIVTH